MARVAVAVAITNLLISAKILRMHYSDQIPVWLPDAISVICLIQDLRNAVISLQLEFVRFENRSF